MITASYNRFARHDAKNTFAKALSGVWIARSAVIEIKLLLS
jgi:hypothetical protein